ncbi:hypothetical protein QC761_0067300 [Podospora bellae-mahoneyi]|uniref:Post-SET domain-containing protein n=1 Tax=Podospora bellae-mahoneyi TaxID=2093777 RepID=A0ABR0FKU2_9PEZI|nr:hypothetical protein QC761_0067300 [Podospora bellae-mahoneyi]
MDDLHDQISMSVSEDHQPRCQCGRDGCEAINKRMATVTMAITSTSLPNGSTVNPPTFYQRNWRHTGRPLVWKKDWDTGVVRPRCLMDDFREKDRKPLNHEDR